MTGSITGFPFGDHPQAWFGLQPDVNLAPGFAGLCRNLDGHGLTRQVSGAHNVRVAGIPNFLSSLRLGFVPVLLMLAYAGHAEIFLVCLVVSLLTDVLDGFIARRFNLASELGAKLDSWADLATTLAMPPCAWWLRPEVLREEVVAIGVALLFYAAAQGAGFVKFRRLPSYHTWSAKVAASLAAAGFVVIFAGGPGWTLRVLAPLVALACLEEIAITLALRVWQPNVPSLWHALQLRKRAPGS